MPRFRIAYNFALAATYTLLNVVKPLTVDDVVYAHFARHIAAHPDDPYGFLVWDVQQANTVLAPPVFLYWWAAAVRHFGEQPIVWKLWLMPISLLFVVSLDALGRRFARGMEGPFVATVVLSPVFLPCLNLMLDVPAQALSLAALVVFLRACDRDSLKLAVVAGLVAGLAVQTKYTGIIAPAAMLAYAWSASRLRLGLAVAVTALLLFVGWEAFVAWRYGDSHFLLGVRLFRVPLLKKFQLATPLFGILGGTGCGVALLALAALGASRRQVLTTAAVFAAGYGFVALVPEHLAFVSLGARPVRASGLVFGLLGVLSGVLFGRVVWKLLLPLGAVGPAEWFLVAWLLLEIGGYFALSPYPAVRRVMGIVVVSSLLAARLAVRTPGFTPARLGVACIATVPFSLFGFALDCDYSDAQRSLANAVASDIHCRQPDAAIWFVGNGSVFEFYSEKAGMKRWPVDGAGVRPGDWLALMEGHRTDGAAPDATMRLIPIVDWAVSTRIPVHSRYQYGNVAWDRGEGPVARVSVYRVGDGP